MPDPDELPGPIELAVSFTSTLERLGIRYLVGGSLASSVHGEPRSTNDIDVVAELGVIHVGPFIDAVSPEYYVREEAVRQARAARLGISDLLLRARDAAGVNE